MMRRLLLAFVLAFASGLLGQDAPAPVPQAVNRKELAYQGIVIVQNGRLLDTRKMSDAQMIAAYQSLLDQDRASGRPKAAVIPLTVLNTLNTIDRTGTAPQGYKGGRQFQNDGRAGGQTLPKTDANGKSITYREWDVNSAQAGASRGTERIVTGSDGSASYTNDHYQTFTRIR